MTLLTAGCHIPTGGRIVPPELATDAPQPRLVRSDLPPDEAALACFTLATEAEKVGNDSAAVVHYLRARALKPDYPELSRRLANAHERQGDLMHAIEEYGQAIRESPKDADLLNDLGYCYYTVGDWKSAEAKYRGSLAIKSKNPRVWNNLGLALGQQDRLNEAREAFNHAVTPAEVETNLGFILLTKGNKTGAEQCYRRALELKPDLSLAQIKLSSLTEARLLAEAKGSRGDAAVQQASYVNPTNAPQPPPTNQTAAPAGTTRPGAKTDVPSVPGQ